jgi:alkylhydroperoxidase family enzyme
MSTQADHDARDKKAQKEIKEKCFVVGAWALARLRADAPRAALELIHHLF